MNKEYEIQSVAVFFPIYGHHRPQLIVKSVLGIFQITIENLSITIMQKVLEQLPTQNLHPTSSTIKPQTLKEDVNGKKDLYTWDLLAFDHEIKPDLRPVLKQFLNCENLSEFLKTISIHNALVILFTIDYVFIFIFTYRIRYSYLKSIKYIMSTPPVNIKKDVPGLTTEEKRKSGTFAVPQTPPKHGSPRHHPYGHHHSLTIPSPVPCRRTRTTSV